MSPWTNDAALELVKSDGRYDVEQNLGRSAMSDTFLVRRRDAPVPRELVVYRTEDLVLAEQLANEKGGEVLFLRVRRGHRTVMRLAVECAPRIGFSSDSGLADTFHDDDEDAMEFTGVMAVPLAFLESAPEPEPEPAPLPEEPTVELPALAGTAVGSRLASDRPWHLLLLDRALRWFEALRLRLA